MTTEMTAGTSPATTTLPTADQPPGQAPFRRTLRSSITSGARRAVLARWPGLKQVWEDRDVNSGWGMPGFQAVATARLGAYAESDAAPRWAQPVLRRLGRGAFMAVRGIYGIELPHTVTLGRRVRIAHQSGIVIHPNAVIGDDCVIRQNVTLGAGRGDDLLFARQAPQLGAGVSIGANAVVLGNVRIGDGATIGPNATVMTHVPAGATVLAPAPRVLRRPVTGSGQA